METDPARTCELLVGLAASPGGSYCPPSLPAEIRSACKPLAASIFGRALPSRRPVQRAAVYLAPGCPARGHRINGGACWPSRDQLCHAIDPARSLARDRSTHRKTGGVRRRHSETAEISRYGLVFTARPGPPALPMIGTTLIQPLPRANHGSRGAVRPCPSADRRSHHQHSSNERYGAV